MNEMFIVFKILSVLKKYRDLFVFTKAEMNNEWNVYCLQNTKRVEKVSRLKLYLQKQKWTMNEMFIVFKILSVLKKYRDWSCIYKSRNEQWMKCLLSSKY